jgi:hypothetical protein
MRDERQGPNANRPRPSSANRDWANEGRCYPSPTDQHQCACARPNYGDIVTGVNTPVLAKHSKNFNLIHSLEIGVSEM